MKLLLFILCWSASFYGTSTLSLDGLTLLSLLKRWTSVPPSLNSRWKSSDSTPCSWPGIQCDRYQNVVFLNLTASQIFGHLGPEIGQLTHLQKLLLATNGFSGTIPPQICNCRLLEYVDLSENHLSGNIPSEIGNCKSLKSLQLYSNQLGGAIPNELGSLSKMEDIKLYFNHLTGEIPLAIWKIQSLKHILLHNNSLSGKLPSEMTELKHLKNISLFDNQFSGPIPQSLGINSSLVKLDLMNNQFTGGIPPNLCFGKQLRTLLLGHNQFQGGIPPDLGRCATLARLDLSDNNLSGPITKFEGNKDLMYMDMSKNNISGEIPSTLGSCTNLIGLILSTNNITGLIPSELGNLLNLQVLNLAHNNLVGTLPLQLMYCTKMFTFDVGFNFLNGTFPSSMRSWTVLGRLILSDNNFSGFVPFFLSEYAQLLELQLGGNMFEGVIRPSIGSFIHLYELNLSSNKLTGVIPSTFNGLSMLESLDLSLNNLTGNIQALSLFFSLTKFNISYNSFFGPLPEGVTGSPSSFLGNLGLYVVSGYKSDSESTDHKGNKKPIFFIALGFVVLVIWLSFVICLPSVTLIRWFMQISDGEVNGDHEGQEDLFSNEEGFSRIFNLLDATEQLHDEHIIGEGGQGIVYKAELDIGVFAIKKVKFAQSNRRKPNMIREIEMTRKIRHQNVARCLGSRIGEEYGLTISRYMENGSLHDVLHENVPLPYLAWNVRYKIAIGIAKGLAYLHHDCDPPILHRDIKPKNILLDSDMQPCITDFGISIALNQPSSTVRLRSAYHIGTRGFMAPEIACMVVPSCELDVYSYGVVLLELITRKKVLDSSFLEEETTLVGWFKSVWRRTNELEEIVDSSLVRELSGLDVKVQFIKVLLVALICTETDPGKRLKMRDVIEFFETPTDPASLNSELLPFFLFILNVSMLLFPIPKEEVKITANRGSYPIIHKVMAHDEKLNNSNIIGRGAHGVVYKYSLGASLVYAVKKVAFAGNKRKIVKIAREIEIIAKIRHPNLVRLLDFLFKKDYCLILYNYMPNGNLHDVLHEKNPLPCLEWNVRYRIAVGIAHGLAYLHYDCHPAIVHCAIKPKNILLDSDMDPCIANFGIAKLLDQSSSTPSLAVPGTQGYITPESTYTTANTREFDVYSYGIILLQLITRKKEVDPSFMNGTEIGIWVRTQWRETGAVSTIVDSSLAEEVLKSDALGRVTIVLLLALSCTEKNPHKRPTMRDVIKQLEDANPRTRSKKLPSSNALKIDSHM
ncbi:receptor-like protein kinase [Neltuma alba]|uniref:receptor-like protein kinase n=1 Tax=Neltuma alba TaxID=207710 RepID=UPI0010A31236|nr:receptor-like protein kinase [Prosopis alba]